MARHGRGDALYSCEAIMIYLLETNKFIFFFDFNNIYSIFRRGQVSV